MKKEELNKYEEGKEYFFKLYDSKRRRRGILTDKDSVFTGLTLYHGTDAIVFKNRRGNEYTISLKGLEAIEEVN